MSSTIGGGAEDEESSSNCSTPTTPSRDAFNSMSTGFRSALEEFRDNWQRELQHNENAAPISSCQDVNLQSPINDNQSVSEAEQQALAESLFRKAVELEQRGKVYDALPFYRKAVQIVPDIEFKFYELNKLRAVDSSTTKQLNNNAQHKDDDDGHDEDPIGDLYEKFQMDLSQDYGGKLLRSTRDAGVISTELHIGDLPPEIMLYILRWVVSSQLDMRSLEQCAGVCKGMYLCARDEDLWRVACLKVWGVNLGTLAAADIADTSGYTSWRQMFIERERVLFSGCYISKTTYLRMGENSFQDQYYRPVQLVEYYRYARFLPDGSVIMMTNADEPAQGVNKLRQLHQQQRPDILRGHYRLNGNTVTLVLQKNHRQQQHANMSRQRRGSVAVAHEDAPARTTYLLEFRIMNTQKRRFCQLMWLHYSIIQTRNKVEHTTNFDLPPSKYPPLWFSPVRSYHLDADAPLA